MYTILQTVFLKDGRKVKVVGFNRDKDGTKLVTVGTTNWIGDYTSWDVPINEVYVTENKIII